MPGPPFGPSPDLGRNSGYGFGCRSLHLSKTAVLWTPLPQECVSLPQRASAAASEVSGNTTTAPGVPVEWRTRFGSVSRWFPRHPTKTHLSPKSHCSSDIPPHGRGSIQFPNVRRSDGPRTRREMSHRPCWGRIYTRKRIKYREVAFLSELEAVVEDGRSRCLSDTPTCKSVC